MRPHLPLLAVAMSVALCCTAQTPRNARDAVTAQQKFDRVFRYLNAYYVDTPDPGSLAETAVRAILSELDPHSAYLTAEEMRSARERIEGSFDGIGIEFGVIADTPVVIRPLPGGPAEQAGIRASDRIVTIDSCRVAGAVPTDIPSLLRGRRGTRVRIETLRHGADKPVCFTVIRDRIPLRTVDAAYEAAPGIGYIHVGRFGRTTTEEFHAAYERLGSPRALILDLRGNGGGLLGEALALAEFFLSRGNRLLSVEGRAIPETIYEAKKGGTLTDGPLAVLIDEGSASASEIVAGALQDWDRGVIIGRPSFGKGLVQRQFTLSDGSALRLTIARYHTPSGRIIQRPYTEGERERYLHDFMRRNTLPPDSLTTGAPRFRTLRTGRPVFGGGGILPDLLTAPDTAATTPWLSRLVRNGALEAFLLGIVDRQRGELLRLYPDAGCFAAKFAVDGTMLDDLAAFGATRGLPRSVAEESRSAPRLRRLVAIELARLLYGTEGAIRIANNTDTMVYKRSIKLLEAWNTEGKKLIGYEK